MSILEDLSDGMVVSIREVLELEEGITGISLLGLSGFSLLGSILFSSTGGSSKAKISYFSQQKDLKLRSLHFS